MAEEEEEEEAVAAEQDEEFVSCWEKIDAGTASRGRRSVLFCSDERECEHPLS